MPAIWVKDLHKAFRCKRRQKGFWQHLRSGLQASVEQVPAVRGISFAVDEGELVAFIGPNGAGKSTTIKMLTGILTPSAGQAGVLGRTPWKEREKLAFDIGTVFGQRSQLWYHLPALDTFNLLAKIYELDPAHYRRRCAELIELFQLGELVDVPVRKLSLGQRMRCEIAASLLHEPKVLFLDEPTIGLDVVAKTRIRELIRRANQVNRVTVLLTSHDVSDIEELCKRVMIVNHGRMIYDDRVKALQRDYLQYKIVELLVQTSGEPPALPGVELLKAGEHGLKFRVDTGKTGIDTVLSALLARYSVRDITISDPPLEEIISKIYQGEAGDPNGFGDVGQGGTAPNAS